MRGVCLIFSEFFRLISHFYIAKINFIIYNINVCFFTHIKKTTGDRNE